MRIDQLFRAFQWSSRARPLTTGPFSAYMALLSVLGCSGGPRPPDPELHQAAARGDIEEVTRQLDSGVSQNMTNTHGDTALHAAIGNKKYEVAKLLLKRGTDINLPDAYGSRITEPFVIGHNLQAVEWILGNGLDPTFRYPNGENELFTAARVGDIPIVRTLLKAGFDPTLKNEDGRTAADLAHENKHFECAKVLDESLPQPDALMYPLFGPRLVERGSL